DAVRHVDNRHPRPDRPDHRVADADELIVVPVVREQRDDQPRPPFTSASRASTSPSMSCRSASTCTSRPCSRAVALVTGPIDTTRAPPGRLPAADMKYRTVELEVKVT